VHDLPSYIPKVVVEHFQSTDESGKNRTDYLWPAADYKQYENLLIDRRMASVWRSISRRTNESNASVAYEFVRAIFLAIQDWRTSLKMTPSEVKKAYLAAADKADMLRQEIADLPSLSKKSLQPIGNRSPESIIYSPEGWERRQKTLAKIGFADHPIHALRRLSNRLRWSANQYKPLVTKVNDPNAERTYVIKRLSTFMRDTFNQPLHKNVAQTVSVLYDCEVDEKHVQNLLK
jgi:hypothetical protein